VRSYATTQYDDQGRPLEFGVVWDPSTATYRPSREGELRPMRNLQGKGFIVVSTDGSLISDELATYDDALDKAAEFLDAPKPGVVIANPGGAQCALNYHAAATASDSLGVQRSSGCPLPSTTKSP
jgi:hypothetical protein